MGDKIKSLAKKLIADKNMLLRFLTIVIGVAFIFVFLFKLIRPVKYHLSQDEIEGYVNVVNENSTGYCVGAHIDESDSAGIIDIAGAFRLRRGSYKYVLTYENSSEGSFIWPHSFNMHYKAISQDAAELKMGEGTYTGYFDVNVKLPVYLRMYYTGTGSTDIISFDLVETPYRSLKVLFFELLALLAVNLLIWFGMQRKAGKISNESVFVFFAGIAVTLVASYPSLSNVALCGHDFVFHVSRIEAITRSLSSGIFPMRIDQLCFNGYGTADGVMYGSAFLYIPALIHLMGMSLTGAYNIYTLLMTGLTVYIAYYSLKGIVGDKAFSMAGAALYVIAPYRMLDVYMRSAVGEYTAMTFLPLIVYGLYRIYTENIKEKKYKTAFVPLFLGMTGIINCHVLTVEMTALAIFLVCLVLIRYTIKPARLLELVKAAAATVIFNLGFLIPFLDYSLTQDLFIFTKHNGYLQSSAVEGSRLFASFTDTTYPQPIAGEPLSKGMTISVGPALLIAFFVALAVLFTQKDKIRKKRLGIMLFMSFFFAWMATVYFPWDTIYDRGKIAQSLIGAIQFPWRFLALSTIACITALIYALADKDKKIGIFTVSILAAISLIVSMYTVGVVVNTYQSFLITDRKDFDNSGLKTGIWEYRLQDFDPEQIDLEADDVLDSEGCTASLAERDGTRVVLHVEDAGENAWAEVPIAYYRDYHTDREKEGIVAVKGNTGVLRVLIPEGSNGDIQIFFREPWYWRVGEICSALSLIALCFLSYILPKKFL